MVVYYYNYIYKNLCCVMMVYHIEIKLYPLYLFMSNQLNKCYNKYQ